MAALATTLTEFSTNGDSRTYTTTGHSASLPKLVIQKRRVPAGNNSTAESTYSVVHGTVDADGLVLASKVAMTVTVKYPVNTGDSAVANALAILRDVVQSDEFGASVTTQNFLE